MVIIGCKHTPVLCYVFLVCIPKYPSSFIHLRYKRKSNQNKGTAGTGYAKYAEGDGDFNGVAFINLAKQKISIKKSQFLQALVDKLNSRLDCTVASKSSDADQSRSKQLFNDLFDKIDILNSSKWPSYVESPWPEAELKSLCEKLQFPYPKFRDAFWDYISQPSTVLVNIEKICHLLLLFQ